jgi:hypothetical protein
MEGGLVVCGCFFYLSVWGAPAVLRTAHLFFAHTSLARELHQPTKTNSAERPAPPARKRR